MKPVDAIRRPPASLAGRHAKRASSFAGTSCPPQAISILTMPTACRYRDHDDEQHSTDLPMPECETDWSVVD
ncbi:hypothetical protein EGY31_15605 [Burkholderia multivorans]|nr:hypothetical protein EGY31_15605 [Burkholderia multivorans]